MFCRVCEPACGLIATVEGGRLVALAADRARPVSQGFVCNKGLYGADLHNDPDRLKVPLERMAPGRFEAVGWDEALADIAQRMRQTLDRQGASTRRASTRAAPPPAPTRRRRWSTGPSAACGRRAGWASACRARCWPTLR